MAVTADSVVVELLAKTDGYNAKINGAATATATGMSQIEASAAKAEAAVHNGATSMSAAADRVASRRERLTAQVKQFTDAEVLAYLNAATASGKAAVEVDRSSARAANASRNLGRQFSDIGASLASGGFASIPLILAQQLGQIIDALSELGEAAKESNKSLGSAGQASGKAAGAFTALATATASTKSATVQLGAADVAAVPATTALSAAARGETTALAGVTAGATAATASTVSMTAASGAATAATVELTIAQRAAAFAAGPLGAALLAVVTVAVTMGVSLLKTGESLESLVEKLGDSAEKARLASQAQRIFDASLIGAADASAKLNEKLQEQNRSQLQVAQSALAAAVALRQTNLQNARAAQIKAQQAATDAASTRARALNDASLDPESRAVALGVAGRAEQDLAAARKNLTIANKGLADAEKAVVEARVPLLDIKAANASDASAAATDRHTRAVDGLRDAYRKASEAARKFAVGDPRRTAGLAAANAAYQGGVTAANNQLTADQDAIRESKKKGPSAEALARRAEAARIREVRNDEAYSNELEQINAQIIAARRQQTTDADRLAEYERDEVASALRKRLAGIDADESARKYSAAEAASLRAKAQEAAREQQAVISSHLAQTRADEISAYKLNDLQIQQEQIDANAGIADTLKERKALELQRLRLAYDRLREEQQAALDKALARDDQSGASIARANLAALPARQQADEAGLDRRYEGAYDRFRKSLTSEDGVQASLDAVKIDSLEAVTDELTNATKAALGLKGAFGQIVGELIRIGIQRAIIGPLADSLFGAADGGGGGAIGSALGRIFGRASGGYVGPGQTVRVNEARGGVELLRMGAQGGTVIPLGQAAAAPSRGVTILAPQQFDLRGVLMTEAVLEQMDARNRAYANQVGAIAEARAIRGAPAYAASQRPLKS